MDKPKSREELKPYLAALKQLARSGQASAVGIEATPLIDMPIVTHSVGPEAPVELRVDAFVAALGETIERRLKGAEQEKARALFGYGEYAGLPMQERYDRVARLHYAKGASWERFRKEPLEDLLTKVLVGLHRQSVALSTSTASRGSEESRGTESARDPVVGGAFSLDRYSITYNFPDGPGLPREILETREVRAARDGVEKWQIASQYWGKSPEQVPEISLFGPGRLDVLHEKKLLHTPYPGQAYTTRVIFPKSLKAGEITTFSLLKRQPVEFDELVSTGYRDQRDVTPVVPISHLNIAVRFPAGRHPHHVWHFEDLPEYLGPGVPDESNTLTLDESGFTEFSWDDLMIGHSYGIAWRW